MISFIWVWYCCCCVICAWCSIDERAPALASFNTQRVYQQYFILCTYNNDSFTGFIIIRLCLILSILLSLHSLYSYISISVHKQLGEQPNSKIDRQKWMHSKYKVGEEYRRASLFLYFSQQVSSQKPSVSLLFILVSTNFRQLMVNTEPSFWENFLCLSNNIISDPQIGFKQ
jgi:hypothetical protein